MVGRPAEGRSDDFVKFDERCIIRPIFQGSVWVGLPSAGFYWYWTIFGKTVRWPQQIAAHQSSRTTEVYDRRGDDVSLDDEKLIRICSIKSVSQPRFCSFPERFFSTSGLVAYLKARTMKVALNPEELALIADALPDKHQF